MKWIETIRVRSSTETLEKKLPGILAVLKEVDKSASTAKACLMRHNH